MKKINFLTVFAGIFILSTSYEQPQRKYYYAFDEKVFLTEVPNKVVLSFDKEYLSEIQSNLQKNVQIKQIGFQLENSPLYLDGN